MIDYWICQNCGAQNVDSEQCWKCMAVTPAAPKNVAAGDGSLDPLVGMLSALSKHLREVRQNQPRVTLAEARAQAKRVMAAARRKEAE